MTETTLRNHILCTLRTHKDVTNGQVVFNSLANIVLNMLGGVGGRIANDFTITLTDKHLLIDSNGYSTWGGLPEVTSEEVIPVAEIESFDVIDVDGETVISLKRYDKDDRIMLICNSERDRSMAIKISELIHGLK